MTDYEMKLAHRQEELRLLREIQREVFGGKHDRDHHPLRHVQAAPSADEPLVAAGSGERLTHAQALERLRGERIRAASHLRSRMRAKGRQQISGGSK